MEAPCATGCWWTVPAEGGRYCEGPCSESVDVGVVWDRPGA